MILISTPCDSEAVGVRRRDTGRRRGTRLVWIGGANQHLAGAAFPLHVRRDELQRDGRGGGMTKCVNIESTPLAFFFFFGPTID